MYDVNDYKVVVDKEDARRESIKKTIQNQIFINRKRGDWYQKHSIDFADHYIPNHPEIWEDFSFNKKDLIDRIEKYYYS